ncbi:uroporphyrinogen-III synthase [Sulfurovum mangrovi]|uniref:uroporphyrinogen-III synthase n=1 Tax=Sulfurovum mangrovi TaxID=2893889 RepID=UPI001E30A1F7|nr:uroporphyrinogen-III synthase [Sulfurovum mangrovi]UFH58494.1 uroporphyrinogen-III synthase [Sulfurovum mangrovi]
MDGTVLVVYIPGKERGKMSTKTLLQDVSKIFKKLNLLYYEYDKYQNKFIVDRRYSKETTYDELIKLTYELSKHDIEFFKDEKSNIVISPKCDLLSPLKQRFKNISYEFKSYRKNIYILSDKQVEHAKNLQLIQTKVIEQKLDLSGYDALIFTSKNGVKYADKLTSEWKKIPSYAISAQTAKEIKDLKGKVALVGKENHGDEFAYELLEHLKGKKIAYLGARKIVSNMIGIFKEHKIECDYIPVYETVCSEYKRKIKLPSDSIIIFSSPSTIECFFKKVTWDKSFTAISIGRTTAKYFPDYIKPMIADNTSLKSCVCKALSL